MLTQLKNKHKYTHNALLRTEEHFQTTIIEEKSIRKTTQEILNSNKITKEIPKEKPNKEQDKTNLKNKPKDRKKLD